LVSGKVCGFPQSKVAPRIKCLFVLGRVSAEDFFVLKVKFYDYFNQAMAQP